MNSIVKLITDINDRMCTILTKVIGVILGLISVILFYSVVMRYVFNNPVTWTEDSANFLMVWMVLLGAPIGLRAGSHVSIELLIEKLPQLISKIVQTFVILIIMYVCWIILRYGWSFAMKGMRRIVPSLEWLKFGYAYMALPVGYGLMILICIEQLLKTSVSILSHQGKGEA